MCEWMIASKVNTIESLPNSLDLNIIENIWGIMTKKLGRVKYWKTNEWRKALVTIWNEVPREHVMYLIRDMPNRIKICLERSGGRIHG